MFLCFFFCFFFFLFFFCLFVCFLLLFFVVVFLFVCFLFVWFFVSFIVVVFLFFCLFVFWVFWGVGGCLFFVVVFFFCCFFFFSEISNIVLLDFFVYTHGFKKFIIQSQSGVFRDKSFDIPSKHISHHSIGLTSPQRHPKRLIDVAATSSKTTYLRRTVMTLRRH